MNKLITYPLIIFFVVMLVNQVYVHRQDSGLFNSIELSDTQDITGNGSLFQNGTETEIGFEDTQMQIDIDFVTGFTALIIGAVALGTVIGIVVLGSCLSERTQKIILTSAICLGLWSMFSLLTYNVITGIPVLGVMLWVAFTFVYMIGFFREVNGGN